MDPWDTGPNRSPAIYERCPWSDWLLASEKTKIHRGCVADDRGNDMRVPSVLGCETSSTAVLELKQRQPEVLLEPGSMKCTESEGGKTELAD